MKRTVGIVAFVVVLLVAGAAGVWLRAWWSQPRTALVGGKTTDAWIERLRAEDSAAANAAMEELVKRKAVEVLLEARKDADIRVHRRSAMALVRVGEPAVPGLIEALPRAGGRVGVILARIGLPAVPLLEKALRDPERAKSAARMIGAMPRTARDAVPALAALLLDTKADTDSRAAAAWALGEIGPEETKVALPGDPLIAALSSALTGPPRVQIEAARALGKCEVAARSAVPSLSRLVREKDVDVARAACETLGKLGTAAAATALAARMQQADGASRAAASALARLGPNARPAIGALIESLRSNKDDALLARAVLERLGTSAVPDLIEALKSDDAVTVSAAADVLGLMGPRAAAAAKPLSVFLHQDEVGIALRAAAALLRIEPEKTKPILATLEPLLSLEEDDIASAATEVLMELGPDAAPAAATLRKLLAAKEVKTVSRAALALGRMRLDETETVADLLAAATKGPQPARPACIEALGRIAAKDAVPALVAMLKEPTLRAETALALHRIDPKQPSRWLPALTADLDGPDAKAQARALLALASMPPPPREVVPALRALLATPLAPTAMRVVGEMDVGDIKELAADLVPLLQNTETRSAAGAMLRAIGPPAVTVLLPALKSRSAEVRIASARVLGTWSILGENPDLRPLLDLLDDEDESVRLVAAQAIAVHHVREERGIRAMTQMLYHARPEFRQAAASALTGVRAIAVADELHGCLFDPAEEVRLAALEAQTGDWDWLKDVRYDPSAKVRQSLADSQSSSMIPPSKQLTEADLRAEDLSIRLEAMRQLTRPGSEPPKEVPPLLTSILEGWDEPARLQAALAARYIGVDRKQLLPALRRRAHRDASDDVRRACQEAITAFEKDQAK